MKTSDEKIRNTIVQYGVRKVKVNRECAEKLHSWKNNTGQSEFCVI